MEDFKMKILVVGSNGRVGSLVVKEALNRGFDVAGLGNEDNISNVKNYLQKML